MDVSEIIKENVEYRRNIARLEVLLGLDSQISSSSTKESLLQTIRQEFIKLFYFDHCSLVLLNEDHLTVRQYVIDNLSKTRNHPRFDWISNSNFDVTDGVLNKILENCEPMIVKISDFDDVVDAPSYTQVFRESGIKEILAVALRTDSGPIGILCFFIEDANLFSHEVLSTVRAGANIVAKSVESFLRHAQLLHMDKENEAIMQLNSKLVAAKDRSDFVKIIDDDLRAYISYDENNLLLYSPERKSYSMYSYNVLPSRLSDPRFLAMASQEYPDTMYARTTHLPIVEDLIELVELGIDWAAPVLQMGIKQVLHLKLLDGNKLVGQLVLMSHSAGFFSESHLSLLQKITYQLAKGMANILANEEILRRDHENQLLLKISGAMNSIREKKDLLPAVKHQLQEIFNFCDICISRYDFQNGTYSVYARDNVKTQKHSDWKNVESAEFAINDGMHNIVIGSDGPVVFSFNDLSQSKQPHIEFIVRAGIREVACVRLKNQNQIVGALVLLSEFDHSFPATNVSLLQRLSMHFATAVSNIIANETIALQFAEIDRYKRQLENEKHYLQEEVKVRYDYNEIVGSSPVMQEVFRSLSHVSSSNSTVLILGETGTGKELIARAIHATSPRKKKMMVRINCAALPPGLVESELFGHERGSFTGAIGRRVGKFELANEGTLFFDEIGELSLEIQSKLLRALQERQIERLGGNTTIELDVRIVAATNRDLAKDVEDGRFRRDLYYRLNVFPIYLPPLRERKEDIAALTSLFLEKYSKACGKKITEVTDSAILELMRYSWPGNIRELEHLVERKVLMSTGPVIDSFELPWTNAPAAVNDEVKAVKTYEENERDHIMNVLRVCNGKIFGPSGAAQALGLKVGTLNSKIKRLGIGKKEIWSS